MPRSALPIVLAVLAAAAGTGRAQAQPSFASTYDDTRRVTLEGAVTQIEWVNPRAFLLLTVRDATGVAADWAVEIGSPVELERSGWTSDSLDIGDVVRVEGVPARGTRRRAFARSVVLASTGRPLFVAADPRPKPPAAPAPRWPDGQVRLGPPPGEKGYWSTASARPLVEASAADVPMTPEGLLLNLADADRVAPFLPWARALYLHRQRTRLRDDPLARCLPPGGPRQFQVPNGVRFVEQRELGRILVLLGGGNRNWRIIHTDGRPQGQPADVVLAYYGHSVGRWDGDTLVVDAVGFNERFWMTAGGLPHTEALHLTERFTRTDLHTLRYEVTVDDPRTYTRPWTGGWTLEWVPGGEIGEYFCEEGVEAAGR